MAEENEQPTWPEPADDPKEEPAEDWATEKEDDDHGLT